MCRVLLVKVERGSFYVRKNFFQLFRGVDVFVVVDRFNRVRGVSHWGGSGCPGMEGNGVFLVDRGNYGGRRLFRECIPRSRVDKLKGGDRLFLFWLRGKWLLDEPLRLDVPVRGVRWASGEECGLIFERFISEYCRREGIGFRSVLYNSRGYGLLYEYCVGFGLEGFLFGVIRGGGLYNEFLE